MLWTTRSDTASPLRWHWQHQGLGYWRQTLLIFLVLSTLLAGAAHLFHEADNASLRRSNLAASERNILRASYEFRHFISSATSDLLALSTSPQVNLLAQGDQPEARRQVTELFYRLLYYKPVFSQLRFLDADGQELVRLKRENSGRIAYTPSQELQNKAGRYYYQKSIKLPPDTLYVSPLDLNIEFGQIEIPWQPVIRVIKPIGTAEGNQGVIVLNISARSFLENFAIGNSGTRSMALLNNRGYWLAGAPDDQLWGFMFGKPNSLKDTHPQLWQQIEEEGKGEAVIDGRHYLFSTLTPADLIEQEVMTSALSGYRLQTDDERWIFMSTYREPAPLWSTEHLPRALILLLITLMFSLFIARTMAARHTAEQINHINEQKMLQMERLASLGTVVAGVAHEVNTPLGNALTIASTLREHADELTSGLRSGRIGRNRLEALLQEIDDGSGMLTESLHRASNIIQNFKEIAVDQTSERRRRFRIDEFLHELVRLHETQMRGTGINLKVRGNTSLMMDSLPGPLGQVVGNLITNARLHGFSDGGPGEIWVEANAAGRGQVQIRVSDNGRGIPENLLPKIFNPFFTTRMNTGGSGLGLSIVQNIVNSILGGEISVASQHGHGTVFTLMLPVSAPQPRQSDNRYGADEDSASP